jgi:hypothetical protein
MKIYYILLIILVLILIFIFRGRATQLGSAPFAIDTHSVVTVELIYCYNRNVPIKKEIQLSELNKILNIIKLYTIPDVNPKKSCPWISLVLHKHDSEKLYINILLRDSDVMVQVGKNSWLIPNKDKAVLEKIIRVTLETGSVLEKDK